MPYVTSVERIAKSEGRNEAAIETRTSDLRPPTSDLRPPISDFRPPTSDLRPPTSDLRPPTSDFRPPTSDLRPPTSDLRPGSAKLVRHFKENGMKMLLEHPANVREMLGLLHISWLDEIDFSRLEVVKTTFIRRDYRHLASDLVYTAPLVGGRRSPAVC
jgi:hypothetical protein